MSVYVRRNGVFVDKKSGEPMKAPERATLEAPMVMKPLEAYTSPVDGKAINSRQERKDDLAKHDCVEWEPPMSTFKGKMKQRPPAHLRQKVKSTFKPKDYD